MNRAALPWVLSAGLAVALLAALSLPRPPREDPEAQRLRSELLAARAEAQGWHQTLIRTSDDLEQQLMATRDSAGLLRAEKAELAREVVALGGQVRVLVDMYTEARGQIKAQGTAHGEAPDSVTAPLDDGLLEGRVAYLPPTQRFDLDYVARLALVLGAIEAPDGRMLLTAKASDPRVRLAYGEVFYQRPDPVQVCTIGERLRWGGWGALGGFIGGLTTGARIRQ